MLELLLYCTCERRIEVYRSITQLAKMISLVFATCLVISTAVAKPQGTLLYPYAPLSDDLIDYVNSVQKQWTAGQFERFARMPLSTLKGMMGSEPVIPDDMPTKVYPNDETQDFLPETFDGRLQWPDCPSLRDIRDQGMCGSCWAFGAVEAMSDRLCIRKHLKVNISAENLVSCCWDLICGRGCKGGNPVVAWAYMHKHGVVTGGQYNSSTGCQPYSIAPCHSKCVGEQPPTPKCEHFCRTGYEKSYNDDLIKTHHPYVMFSVHHIMRDILKHGSVEASFTVYADFMSYKSGVYQHTHGNRLGGHAVKIIGWGVENGVEYWLVANSWNTDWGDHGYFKIRRGVNECGIERFVIAAEV